MATPLPKPGYREFTATKLDGTKVKLSARLPHQKELQAADLEMSATYNRSLMTGLPTQQRILRELKANGLWTEANKQELLDLQKRLAAAETKVKGTFTTAEDEDAAKAERLELQDKFGDLRSEFESMLEHTADSKSSIAYRNFLIACTIEYATAEDGHKKGERVFSSLEDFMANRDALFVQRIIYEYSACLNNMDSEWTANEQAEELLKAQLLEATAAAAAELKTAATQDKTTVAAADVQPVIVDVTPTVDNTDVSVTTDSVEVSPQNAVVTDEALAAADAA